MNKTKNKNCNHDWAGIVMKYEDGHVIGQECRICLKVRPHEKSSAKDKKIAKFLIDRKNGTLKS